MQLQKIHWAKLEKSCTYGVFTRFNRQYLGNLGEIPELKYLNGKAVSKYNFLWHGVNTLFVGLGKHCVSESLVKNGFKSIAFP
jgi:hypothetical protein